MASEEDRPDPVLNHRSELGDDHGVPAGSATGPDAAAPAGSATDPDAATPVGSHPAAPNMLPGRERRRSGIERLFVRVIATGGVVGIGVALGAILAANKVQGWIIGLAIALVSVLLSAVLWSSRQL
jgi:hypothetical protein